MKKIILAAGLALLSTGCGGNKSVGDDSTSDSTTATTATTVPTPTSGSSSVANITVPDVVGRDLQFAQDTMQGAGLYNLKSHDSTGRGRLQVLDRNWEVTDQTPAAGTTVAEDQLIDLGARKFAD